MVLIPDHGDHRMVENGEPGPENKYERISREDVYFGVAREYAKRSTCPRKAVGAVLVRDNHILGTGYNGAARLQAECMGSGCLMVSEHCVRTVHAEVNAVLSAAYNGVSTKGATLYTTAKPCFRCEFFLINAGIKQVVYDEEYDDGMNTALSNAHMIRRHNGRTS